MQRTPNPPDKTSSCNRVQLQVQITRRIRQSSRLPLGKAICADAGASGDVTKARPTPALLRVGQLQVPPSLPEVGPRFRRALFRFPRPTTFELYLHGARGAGERIPPPPPPTPPPPPPPLPLLTHSESLASLPEVGALRARVRRPPSRCRPRSCRPGIRRRAPAPASGSGRLRS